MRDEFVPLVSAKSLLKVRDKGVPLFIRDARKRIIRVFALEIDHEFRVLVVFAEEIHRVRERFPSDDGREVSMRFAVSTLINTCSIELLWT